MPGTFSPPPRVSDPDRHHGTCVTHVPGCMPGSTTSGFLWSRYAGKRSRRSRRMRNPQFCVSGKRPMMTRLWYLGLVMHIHVNRVNIGSGNGLVSVGHQVITSTNGDILSAGSLENQIKWDWNQNIKMFFQTTALENAVCKLLQPFVQIPMCWWCVATYICIFGFDYQSEGWHPSYIL